MNRAVTSLLSSLEQLSDVGRNRAREEADRERRRQQRTRVDALVVENQRRRAERNLQEVERRRRDVERLQRLEREARLRGRREAEAARARIQVEHEARMRELALAHDIERSRLAHSGDRRARHFGWVAACLSLLWVMTVVVFGGGEESPGVRQTTTMTLPATVTADLAPPPAAAMSSTAEAAETEAASSEPATSVALTSRSATRRRGSLPKAVATPDVSAAPRGPAPPAPPAPVCDDTSGDPCCAFGEIVC